MTHNDTPGHARSNVTPHPAESAAAEPCQGVLFSGISIMECVSKSGANFIVTLRQIRTRIRIRICLSAVLKSHLQSLQHFRTRNIYSLSLQRRVHGSLCLFISNLALTSGAVQHGRLWMRITTATGEERGLS